LETAADFPTKRLIFLAVEDQRSTSIYESWIGGIGSVDILSFI
jgi:hypothetical protein